MSEITNQEQKPPKGSLPLGAQREAYAFERSLGVPPSEAVRRAGANPRVGAATKWERSPQIQARIRYFRAQGQTDEMLQAKRARIEERLALAAYTNIFAFAKRDPETGKVLLDATGDRPQIDWELVAESDQAVVISSFKFDKDTGRITYFERDDALQAAAQLRDMHGFRAPARHDHTLRTAATQMSDDELARIAAGGGSGTPATPNTP